MQLLTAINLLNYNNKYCFMYYYFAPFGEIFCPRNNEPIRVDRRENNGRSLDAKGISLSQYCPCQLMAVWTGANELSSTVASDSILLSVVGKFPELKVRQPCKLQ